MTTDELVRSLVGDLTPVRRLRGVARRAALWALLALAYVGLGAWTLGARSDLGHKIADATFLAESAALLVTFSVAARAAFLLSVPGAARGPLTWMAPALASLLWILLVLLRASLDEPDLDLGAAALAGGWRCVARTIGLSLGPTVAALLMLRRAAPHARGWTGLLAALSASSLAVVGTQVVCARDAAGHVLAWHAGPVVAVALLGVSVGRWFLARPALQAPLGRDRAAAR